MKLNELNGSMPSTEMVYEYLKGEMEHFYRPLISEFKVGLRLEVTFLKALPNQSNTVECSSFSNQARNNMTNPQVRKQLAIRDDSKRKENILLEVFLQVKEVKGASVAAITISRQTYHSSKESDDHSTVNAFE